MPKFADRLTVLKAVRARTARALDCTPGPNPPRSSQVEEDLRVRLLQLRSDVSATDVLNELHLTDKIAKKELNVPSLGPTGFEFLQQYFLAVNEREEKLEKIKPKNQYGGNSYSGAGYGRTYGTVSYTHLTLPTKRIV